MPMVDPHTEALGMLEEARRRNYEALHLIPLPEGRAMVTLTRPDGRLELTRLSRCLTPHIREWFKSSAGIDDDAGLPFSANGDFELELGSDTVVVSVLRYGSPHGEHIIASLQTPPLWPDLAQRYPYAERDVKRNFSGAKASH
jgi:hypothetical protein